MFMCHQEFKNPVLVISCVELDPGYATINSISSFNNLLTYHIAC